MENILFIYLRKFILWIIFPIVFSINVYGAKKGDRYFYWGWNRGFYSKSDITFKGTNYEFTLSDVVGNDRPNDFGFSPYFHPLELTIPQTNARFGYFFHDHYDISVGLDHMKYVVKGGQTVKINGSIKGTGSGYDGTYSHSDIQLNGDFLQLEHTDGLNYLNIELRRFDKLFDFDFIGLPGVAFNLTEGIGAGIVYPKTNSTLLGKERSDTYTFSGFGIAGVVGINISFVKSYFVQSELKLGYINMPWIKTTKSSSDEASQSFTFTQVNMVLGVLF
jgi:hypothetical protein